MSIPLKGPMMLNTVYVLELHKEGLKKNTTLCLSPSLDQLQQHCKMGSAQAVVRISKAFG